MTAAADLEANYAGAFDGHLKPGQKPALLIIDMVMAYFTKGSPLYADFTSVIASTARLLNCARTSGIPVIFTNVVFQAGGKDGGLFYQKVPALKLFDKGSPLGAFPSDLSPQDGEIVISKNYASAFFGTSLSSTLTSLKVDTLIITGVSTSGCVRATALDTLQHGFAPFVVSDACGDRHKSPHDANLFDMQAKYAEVIDEAAALQIMALTQKEDRVYSA